mmetsp:Transcript_66709/g.168284  ORF Transcript_66709/g.168284 Transcript_66709/m.168284 type:complete len:543 (+) Transcript_66709:108-1736(+)
MGAHASCGHKSDNDSSDDEVSDARSSSDEASSDDTRVAPHYTILQRISNCFMLRRNDTGFVRSDTLKVRNHPRHFHGAKALLVDNTGKNLEDAFFVDQRRVVGEGGYASVVIGKDKRTGVERAVKCITKKMVANRDRLQREIDIVMSLDHPNINKLYQTFEDRKFIYLILELCAGGELFDRIQELGHLSEREAAIIMQQIFRAVFYMHQRGVCHRDLKPENFLFQLKAPIEGNTLKVIDFGIAATFDPPNGSFTTRTGTPYYVAPEVLQFPFTQYGPECDMWSSGVIMYVLLSGRLPFRGVDDNATFAKVKSAKVSFPSDVFGNVSEAAKTLIRQLLNKDPARRYTAEEAVNDPWAREHAPTAKPAPLKHSVVEALRCFQAENKLKKAALHVIARQLDESQIKQLRHVFMDLDVNGDGHLTMSELSEGLRRSELQGNVPEDLNELLKSLDVDGSGQIDYTEFLAATLERRQCNNENICWAAFRVFDKNNDGKISQKELLEVLASQDVVTAIGQDTVTELMREVDRDGDGFIDFEEFMAMMMR